MSLSITNFSWHTADIAEGVATLVRRADDGHLDTIWVQDHVLQLAPGTEPDDAILEAYTTLGYLAALTRRVRLGTLVTAATYRSPALLVKAVTTVDVLSGGRAWLGVGAGYQEVEAETMGMPLPATTERFERLEETLRLTRQMWDNDKSPFHGKHYHATRPINSPAPLTLPRPPILIAGTGERKTLRLVAQYADACNLYDIPDGGTSITHKLAVLAEHCATFGRSLAEIDKTVAVHIAPDMTAEQIASKAAYLADLGIDHMIAMRTAAPWSVEDLDVLDQAIGLIGGS